MTDFEILEKKAIEEGTEEAMNRLGEWYETEGMRYWNGEAFYGKYEGREYHLVPVYEETEDGDFEIVGWDLRW